ncbi:MAG: SUMF1/EgtB/PvdO family nonheme iron enzyme, partial [Granulosicoccaceae bacterium]|jgi:formylglycine-generating enzyme required for sulfatase activity/CRP-like cAMP-binding protein
MGAVIKKEDMIEGLRSLVPISALPDEKFAALLEHLQIEQAAPGEALFNEGDMDNRAVYLLSGKVDMLSGKSFIESVTGGTSAARYPLAHHTPRQLTARARGAVATFVRIDTQLLDQLLTTRQSDTYEVTDELDEDDWMAQLLQSDAFVNLPASNIQAMFMQLEELPVKSGHTVLREGDEGDYFYIVRQGRCKVTVAEPSGKTRVVAELGPADSFGEEALISGERRNATITMITDGLLMRLPQESFDQLMKAPLINWVDLDEATEIVKQGGMWLDVRLPNEHTRGSIAGSKNLPLSVLRNNIDRLDTSRKYVTYCDNGTRSSIAAFLLSQRGVDAYVLAGGYSGEERVEEEIIEEGKADKAVIDFSAQQAAARKKAEEQATSLQDERAAAVQRAEEEARRREALENELKKMREEQLLASERAEEEVSKRLKAEQAVAQMKKEQEQAFKKAQEEIQKRKAVTEEAEHLKAEAETARKQAEEEAEKLRSERKQARAQADKELEELRQQREALLHRVDEDAAKMRAEAEAARNKAEEEARRLHEEAEAARNKAEADSARLRAEAEAAKQKAEEQARRLQEEQQRTRDQAEEQARRLRGEAEELRRRAEEETRQRSEALASEIVAEAEAARLKAEQEAAQLLAEAEGARLEAEAEAARFFSSQEEARLAAEQEVARLQAEAEQARLRADEEKRRMSEVEARRLAAEEEAARLKADADRVRMDAEEAARQRHADAEAARLAAEEEAAQIKADAEHARMKAEEEVARLQAEAEMARLAEDNAEQLARLEAETNAARLEAEEALRLKQEAEERRKQAEQEAIRIKVEAEQSRQVAEDESRRLIEEAESARERARNEAVEVSKSAEEAREQAREEVRRLQEEAETTRKKAEHDANRLRSEADDAQQRAETMILRMHEEANQLRSDLKETSDEVPAAAAAEPDGSADLGELIVEEEAQAPEEIEEIVAEPEDELAEIEEIAAEPEDELAEIEEIAAEPEDELAEIEEIAAEIEAQKPLESEEEEPIAIDEIEEIPIDDDSELVVSEDRSSQVVTATSQQSRLDEDDEISKLIDAAASETVKSGFVLPETMQEPAKRSLPVGIIAAIGGVLLAAGVAAFFLFSGGDKAPTSVVQPRPPVAENIPEAVPESAPIAEQAATPVTAPQPEPAIAAPAAPAIGSGYKPVSFSDALRIGGTAPVMMRIPAGSFTMGSPGSSTNFDERPAHTVTLQAFNMSRHEVTVGDYRRYLSATGRDSSFLKGRDSGQPVTKVSWLDAQRYVKWLSAQTGKSYRLPTEAEWEYAAAAGAQTVYWWGNDLGEGKANCFGCGSKLDGKLARIGSFEANVLGLHDMSGNVMEWTQDCANSSYKGAPTDGSAWQRGDCTMSIVRGGAYNTPSDNLRTRKRNSYARDSQLDNIGIRLVRD